MSGHGANPIFFNKKNKGLDVQNTCYPLPPTSDNISFLPYPLTSTLLKVEVICVSPPLFVIKVSNLN